MDSKLFIGPFFWCKGVTSKECAVTIFSSGLLKCVEGFQVVVSFVETEFA